MIVDLEECPAEHLFSREQMLNVGAMVGGAGVACAGSGEGRN